MNSLPTKLVITATGLTCKSVFKFGLCSAHVSGYENLRNALENNAGGGVITVSNHISTLDDPLSWGVLPVSHWPDPFHKVRWSLGASDIMFTNPVFSSFFRWGQTIETFRGKGVYQTAIDLAIERLNSGAWVHLFGEGKINQPNVTSFYQDEASKLPRFKWGVGRVIMCSFPSSLPSPSPVHDPSERKFSPSNLPPEAPISRTPPTILPMFLSGFDHVMPEGRSFPWKYLPRFGQQISVAFGEPIPPSKFASLLEGKDGLYLDSKARKWEAYQSYLRNEPDGEERLKSSGLVLEDSQTDMERLEQLAQEARDIRSRITAVIQDAVEDLGRRAMKGELR